MAAPQTAQEALRAWLSLLSPEERRVAESAMGATLPASAQASDEPTHVAAPDEPTPTPSQADPSTTPIPEEPDSSLLAQREWYDSQDKIFQGLIPPETPWQDDDLSAQPPSSASPQPTLNETSTEPQAPDQEPWLLPKPDTRLFNIFGDSFELQALKEKIAKGQMPHCLFKDQAAVDQQPLNRQELWAAMQYKPIYRTAGKWTYWDLLPDDIRQPPPQFCNEIEDAPKQPPASRLQPKEKDSWADATEQEAASQTASSSKPQPAQDDLQDLSSADPAMVYKPQLGQPYLFDIDLLDRRAQPLYAHPHYKPIECMVFDKRPWICFYGGSTPTVVAETDGYWYTMYDREGGCCLQGWPMFLLQDFMRLFADPPPSPEPTTQADDAASSPRTLSERGSYFQPTIAHRKIGRDMQPRDIPGRQSPKTSLQPSLPIPASDAYFGTAYHHKGEKDVGLPTPTYPAMTSDITQKLLRTFSASRERSPVRAATLYKLQR
ncbi:hypothetical protein AK812_SmicGene7013 [Symbiodinium microadriaticum]|uniref:Uncharacterized protein n=1 Tax=Symbiodinium microadriaticum TaxID=2951 RepID=A0A1Q9EPT6_SYMMI|nr:hypothetical protein AK812_SmicGene7013 [Symbiodinium microadriaticum]